MKTLIITTLLFISQLLHGQTNDPWLQYMTPALPHSIMEEYTGNFTMEVSILNQTDSAQIFRNIQVSSAMILGGRFLELDQTGKLGGMEYEGKLIIGYNTADQKMSLVSISNLGTGTLYLEGTLDEKSRTANLKGGLLDPVTLKKTQIRQLIRFIDKNTLIIINYDQSPGEKEIESMQYKFVRKI